MRNENKTEIIDVEDFTATLNHLDNILKTDPGKQSAIKGKSLVFENWLRQYKNNAQYLEMLELLENKILPDESLSDDHIRFKGEYDEAVQLYTQEYLKSRIRIGLEPMAKEMEKKRELIESYEKLLISYRELRMNAEYDQLLKMTGKIKAEMNDLDGRIELNTRIIEVDNIFKVEGKAFPAYIFTMIESLIKEGVSDKYIQATYKKLVSAVWDRKYKLFNIISVWIYTVFNSYLGIKVYVHYSLEVGGFFNIVGCVAGGMVFLFMVIMLWIMHKGTLSPSILREKKKRIFLYELGKFGCLGSLPIVGYINMIRHPEIFFQWNLLLAILLLIVSMMLASVGMDSSRVRQREPSTN